MKTTLCEVVSDPGSFDGKIIELRADVSAGLETNILYDKNCEPSRHLPARILMVEATGVRKTHESKKFWHLVQAYKEPQGKRSSILPDKYTVTATVVGRFVAATTARSGGLELHSVRNSVARPFDASFLPPKNSADSVRSER